MKKITIWVFWLLVVCAPLARTMAQGRAEQGGMKIRLQRVYLQDSLLWLRFQVKNNSAYDFRVGGMGFRVRQRRQLRRTAFQEFRLPPLVRNEPSTIPGDSVVVLVYGLAPRVIGQDKELVAELRERNHDRVLRVVIRSKTLLHARSVSQHAASAAKSAENGH